MRPAFFRLVLFIFVHMYLILPLFNCFDNLVFGRGLETIKKGRKETEKKVSYIRLLHRFSFKQRQICFDKKKKMKKTRVEYVYGIQGW